MQALQRKIARGSKLKDMEDFQELSTVNKKFTKNWLVVKDIWEKKKGEKAYGNEGFIWTGRISQGSCFPDLHGSNVQICGSVSVSYFYLGVQCLQNRKTVTCRRGMRWTVPLPSFLSAFYMHVPVLFSQEEQPFGLQTGTTAVLHFSKLFPINTNYLSWFLGRGRTLPVVLSS